MTRRPIDSGPRAGPEVRHLRVTVSLVALAGLSSLLGLVRDQTIARFFGTSAQTDAYLVAWTVPETAVPLFMEGALALLLVPVFARALAGGGSIRSAVRTTFASFCLAMLALTVAVAVAAPVLVAVFTPGLADPALAVRCLRVSATTVLSLGIAGYLMSALRTSGQYLLTMTVYIAFNVGVLVTVLVLRRSAGVYAAAIGLAVGAALTVVVQIGPFLRRTSLRRLRLLPARSMAVAVAGVLPVATYTIGRQAQVFVERYYGSGLRPGAISALNYAEKIGQIPMQAATMLAVVSFPLLAAHAATGRSGELRRTAERDLRMAAYLIAPAVGLFVALAPQIVSVLFRRGAFGGSGVAATSAALRAYSLGLPGQTLVAVGAVCLSSLAPASWSLARAAAAGLALTVLADALSVHRLGISGLALGNALGITLTSVMVILALRRRLVGLDAADLAGAAARAAGAAAIAGAAGGLSGWLRLPPILAVLVAGTVVAGCYVAVARLVGLDEARQTLALARTGIRMAAGPIARATTAAAGAVASARAAIRGFRTGGRAGLGGRAGIGRRCGGPAGVGGRAGSGGRGDGQASPGRRAGSGGRPRSGHRAGAGGGQSAFAAVAVLIGGCLGLAVAALTPARWTATQLLLVVPPPRQHQSALQTRYAAGVQRAITDIALANAVPQVRMVVTPDAPLIEIDATAGSAAAAIARADAAATAAELVWPDRTAAAGLRLVPALPAAVSAQRTAPNLAVDGIVTAALAAAATTTVAAALGRWPALSGRLNRRRGADRDGDPRPRSAWNDPSEGGSSMDLICPACSAPGRPHPLVADGRYRLVRCFSCRTQYFRPDERLAATADRPVGVAYRESYRFDLYGSPVVQAALDARHDRILGQARRYVSPLASVLDVGCGVGDFLAHAQATGLRAVGSDVDELAVQVARERSLDACVADDLDGLVPDESVDAASMWDVVEHLFDPVSALRGVVTKVRPGGALIFETPDAAFPIRRLLLGLHRLTGGRVNLAKPMYQWDRKIYFTESGLRRLLARVGVDVIWTQRGTSLRERTLVALDPDRKTTALGRLLGRGWPVLDWAARRLGGGNKLLVVGRKRDDADLLPASSPGD